MRMPAMIIGILLLVFGALMATGAFHYTDTKRVVDLGPLKVNKTEEHAPPLNWGYILLGGGLVLVVVGALAGRKE
jgi:hypothetical protein